MAAGGHREVNEWKIHFEGKNRSFLLLVCICGIKKKAAEITPMFLVWTTGWTEVLGEFETHVHAGESRRSRARWDQ